MRAVRIVRIISVCLIAVIVGRVFDPVGYGVAQEKTATLPHKILIIRHAEKQDDSVHLNPMGMERADKLHELFRESKDRPVPFPTPDFIFATKNSKGSHRPVETVTPLAEKLKLTVNSDYADDEFAKLAEHIFKHDKYTGKTILICWHHGKAPELARALGAEKPPKHWNPEVFDRVWELKYKDNKVSFHDRPQQLLSMDSAK
jgi:hypothetical protein